MQPLWFGSIQLADYLHNAFSFGSIQLTDSLHDATTLVRKHQTYGLSSRRNIQHQLNFKDNISDYLHGHISSASENEGQNEHRNGDDFYNMEEL